MKCHMHPMNNAIAVCPSCGRAICEICRVNVLSIPHCKECAEQIIARMATFARKKPPKIPVSRGTPKREYFILGAIGALIMVIGAGYLGYFTWEADYSMRSYPASLIIYSAFFSIGLLIIAFGFYGFYKNYGSIMGLVSSVFLWINSVLFLPLIIFSVEETSYSYWHNQYEYRIEVWYFISAIVLFGICLALMGACLLTVKNYMMTSRLSKSAGILNIADSFLFVSILSAVISGIAWFVLIVACALMAFIFLTARLPIKSMEKTSQMLPPLHQ